MFSKKKPDPGPAPELVERWKAIASKPAPDAYLSSDDDRMSRSKRSPVYRQATATLSGGEKLPVVIRNLSHSGCRIEFFRKTPLTGQLVIDEQTTPLHFICEVVWQGDGAAGLQIVQGD